MGTLALAPCWAVWTDGRARLSSKDGAYRFHLAPAIPTFRLPWPVVCRSKTKPPTTLIRSALSLHPTLSPAWSPLPLHARTHPFFLIPSQRVNCLIGAVRPNVKDEPRRQPARRVQHNDHESLASFRSTIRSHAT
jgi:hypothetical protein